MVTEGYLDRIPDWAMPLALHDAVCPIFPWRPVDGDQLAIDPEELGTAFFVSDHDVVTAKHVVAKFLDDPEALSVFVFGSRGEPCARYTVTDVFPHPTADLAFCRVRAPARQVQWPAALPICIDPLEPGEEVIAFGYADTQHVASATDRFRELSIDFRPHAVSGRVDAFHANGFSLAKGFPAYTWDGDTFGGHSGAPVIARRTGGVHAICCSGFDGFGTLTDVRLFADVLTLDPATTPPEVLVALGRR